MGSDEYVYYIITTFISNMIFAFFYDKIYILILSVILYRILDFYLNSYKYDPIDILYYFGLALATIVGYIFGRLILLKDTEPFTPELFHEKLIFRLNGED